MAKAIERHAKEMQTKSRTHQVVELAEGIYDVTSGKSGRTYRVTLGAHGQVGCTCNWGKYRNAGQPSACSHTLAVYEWMAENEGRRTSAWASEAEAKRQHKAIRRDLAGDGLTLTTAKR